MEKGKLGMLEDWWLVRNAILRAESGKMKVVYLRPEDDKEKKKGVVGIAVDVELTFSKPLPEGFTEEEKKAVKEAMEEVSKKIEVKE